MISASKYNPPHICVIAENNMQIFEDIFSIRENVQIDYMYLDLLCFTCSLLFSVLCVYFFMSLKLASVAVG